MAGNKQVPAAKSLLFDTLELSSLFFNTLRENRGEGGSPPFSYRVRRFRRWQAREIPKRNSRGKLLQGIPITRSPDDPTPDGPIPRTIFHVDMDAFFVSVEELFDPSLKGKPVVVGGQRDERGVVSAASYAARKFGVHSAMPLRTAAKLCPQAIFVNGHPERYREYSGRVHEVLGHFSPLVEMASVDEAYLDMTGTERLHGPSAALGASVARRDEIGDTIELFGRDRDLAADRQSFVGQGKAEWSALGAARPGSKISGAARGGRHPWSRQGDGAEAARDRD